MCTQNRNNSATSPSGDANNSRRILFWAPVIHTQADMGSMSESVRQLFIAKFGKFKWQKRSETVEDLWRRLQLEIEHLHLDFSKVRLYQDGLPCSRNEIRIVQDLAAAGSLNHRILLDLIEKGATLTGTESVALLLEEYEMARQVLDNLHTKVSKAVTQRQQDFSSRLLEKRDAFIADRIGKTLLPGETGLIFLGMLHSLEGRLAPDIGLTRLGRSSEMKTVITEDGVSK